MNILLIAEFFPKKKQAISGGGVEARNLFTYQYLKTKHNVKVIHRQRNLIAATFLSIFPRLTYIITAAIKAINSQADIIEGSNFVTYLPAYFSARIKRVPSIAWYPDIYKKTWFENFSFLTAFTGYLLEWIGLRLNWDHIIAMSQSTKTKLIQAGIDPQKITVVYGGVDTKKMKNLNVKKYPSPTICTIARLVKYKRVDDLIKATAIIKQTVPNIKLKIISQGPEEDSLRKLTRKLNLTGNVEFLGSLSHQQAMKVLKKSHIFSLPSIVEGFGLVTIEAMAAGIPYVSSDIPPTREITQNGKGGFLYPPKNYQELALNITKLLTNKKIYQQKHKQAIAIAREYDWDTIASQTLKVYKQTVSKYNLKQT